MASTRREEARISVAMGCFYSHLRLAVASIPDNAI